MSLFQKDESIDSVTTEDIKTEPSDSNANEEDSEDVILESIEESDISAVESLPGELTKSNGYKARTYSYTNDFEADIPIPKSTAMTPGTQRTVGYNGKFADISLDPRGGVRDPQNARIVINAAFSSDLENTWYNEELPVKKSTESIDTSVQRREPDRSMNLETPARSYSTETFESEVISTDRYLAFGVNLDKYIYVAFCFKRDVKIFILYTMREMMK